MSNTFGLIDAVHAKFTNKSESETWNIIYKIQGVIVIILNVMVIMIIVARKQLRKRHSNKFLLSLLGSHILLGCCDLGFSFSMHFNEVATQNKSSQTITQDIQIESMDYVTGVGIILFMSLLIVTVDRIVSIKYPFAYLKLTTAKVISIIVVIWLLSISYTTLSYVFKFSESTGEIITLTLMLASFITLSISNWTVYVIVRKQIRQIMSTIVEENLPGNNTAKTSKRKLVLDKQLRALHICVGMVISYVIFWSPLLIHDIAKFSGYKNDTFSRTAILIVFCNSLADPIIYCIINRDLKLEILQIVHKRRRQSFAIKTFVSYSSSL